MTIDEIRRANLITLVDKYGTVKQFSEKIEKSEAQVSQWRNASLDSRTGRPRGISDDICRHIEDKCELQRGWMDNVHTERKAPDVSPDKLLSLVAIYGQLNEFDRQLLLDFAQSTFAFANADQVGAATQNKV